MTTIDTVQPIEPNVRRNRRVPSVLVLLSLAIIALTIVATLVGQWITPHDPDLQNAILGVQGPSGSHWFGTDQLGRDVFSRLIVGTRNAMLGPICVAIFAVLIGLVFGMAAGYRGGRLDSAITRSVDILYCLPALMIAIVVVGAVGGGYAVTIAVFVFLMFPGDVRIFRSVTLVQARLPYVDAARTLGLSSTKTLTRHIVPNILPTIVATFLLEFTAALVGFSALAFLGLGVAAGSADWGTVLADGQSVLFINPMMSLGPAIFLILVAASVTIVGDWLYDRFTARGEQ